MLQPSRTKRRDAFTLIELLVVIAIIAILISLLLPAVQKVRDAAAKTECINNLKQIGIAIRAYESDHKHFPAGNVTVGPCCSSKSRTTWTIEILPYLEQANLYKRYVQTTPNPTSRNNGSNVYNEDAQNAFVRTQFVKSFTCPSDLNTQTLANPESGPGSGLQYAPGSYRAVSGKTDGSGWLDNREGERLPSEWRGLLHTVDPSYAGSRGSSFTPERNASLQDGSSNTIIVGEYHTLTRNRRRTFWAYAYTSYNQSSITTNQTRTLIPDYNRCVSLGGAGGSNSCKRGFGSLHVGGNVINWLYADGSARTLTTSVDINILADSATIAGGEVRVLH